MPARPGRRCSMAGAGIVCFAMRAGAACMNLNESTKTGRGRRVAAPAPRARLAQFRGPQQAADLVGAERGSHRFLLKAVFLAGFRTKSKCTAYSPPRRLRKSTTSDG